MRNNKINGTNGLDVNYRLHFVSTHQKYPIHPLTLILAILFALIPMTIPASAADPVEIVLMKETNRLETSDTVKWHNVTLTKPGQVSLNFSHANLGNDRRYWWIDVFDETDNKLLTLESWGNQTSVDSRNNYLYLGVGTYYVRVQRDQYSHSAADYILTVNFTENIGQFEIESNVSKTTATEMNVDKAITGNLYNGNDVDFYKFHLSAPGRVSLNFRHRNLENDRRYWWIDVFDETDNKLLTLESWGNQISVDSSRNNYLYLGVGTYYVRVQRDQFSHSAADYILTVNFTENIGQFEIESNASKTTATAMIVNKAITGNLYNDSDVDWYKFTLAGQNEVFLNFKHDNLENDSRYWWIDVFDETGDVILTMDSNGKNTVKNSGKISIGTGTYNVRVQRDQYSHSTSNYTMTVDAVTTIDGPPPTASVVIDSFSSDKPLYTVGDMVRSHVYVGSGIKSWQIFWIKNGIVTTEKAFIRTEEPLSAQNFYAGTVNNTTYDGIALYAYTTPYTAGTLPNDLTTGNPIIEKARFPVSPVETTIFEEKNSLETSDTVNQHRVVLTKPGRISLNFRHRNLENDRRYWWIDVFDETYPLTGYRER